MVVCDPLDGAVPRPARRGGLGSVAPVLCVAAGGLREVRCGQGVLWTVCASAVLWLPRLAPGRVVAWYGRFRVSWWAVQWAALIRDRSGSWLRTRCGH